MSANPQGIVQPPNQIQATQQTLAFYPTSVLCNDDNTITIDAETINFNGQFNPPISSVGSYIISTDSTAKVDCIGTNITQITGDIDMQTGFIQNLGSPSQSADAVNLGYLQTNYYTSGQTNGAIGIALEGYYEDTVPLDQISLASASVNLNTQKIINLADATLPTDAMNQQASDARYYLNTVPLNGITIANNDVDINNNKLTNLKDGTGTNDSVNFGQLTTTNTNLSDFIAKFQYGSVTIGVPNNAVTTLPISTFSGSVSSATKASQFASPPHYTQTITINYSFSAIPKIFVQPQCTLTSPTGVNYSFSSHILAVSATQAQIVVGNNYVTLADVSDLILNFMFIV